MSLPFFDVSAVASPFVPNSSTTSRRILLTKTTLLESTPNSSRMKKQANLIYKSVMADGPEWLTPEEQAAAMSPEETDATPARSATTISRSYSSPYR